MSEINIPLLLLLLLYYYYCFHLLFIEHCPIVLNISHTWFDPQIHAHKRGQKNLAFRENRKSSSTYGELTMQEGAEGRHWGSWAGPSGGEPSMPG
jgi:hypothetical protein